MNKFKDGHLYYLPLGGIGIFGANCYLYRYQGKWIMIDCGLAFNKDLVKYPGIDIMFPDVSFFADIKKDLLALICTHGHEEHIGAVPYLWSQLECPVYGSEFTLKLIGKKLKYHGKIKNKMPLKIVKPYEKITLGGFNLEFMPVVHSIPGSFSIKITVGGENIIHAGDWRLDDEPMLEFSDEKQWKKAGSEGVKAFVCESTNFGTFEAGQDKELVKPFAKIFSQTKGCAYVSIFASNIARIIVLIKAAKKAGRYVGIVGTGLVQNSNIAEACGLLDYDFLSVEEMETMPKDEMVIILTGALGQRNSALEKISEDRLGPIDLEEDDVVVLSSRPIPGSEENIKNVVAKVEAHGSKVITSDDEFVHVSGHSDPSHVEKMNKWLKPEILIAMHGEDEQLGENVDFAKKCGIKTALTVQNGEIYDIFDKELVGKVATGLVCRNHGKVVPINSSAIKEKKRIAFNGACIVSVVLNEDETDILRKPKITLLGLDDNKEKSQQEIESFLEEQLDIRKKKITEEAIAKIVKTKLKQLFHTEKPIIEVQML